MDQDAFQRTLRQARDLGQHYRHLKHPQLEAIAVNRRQRLEERLGAILIMATRRTARLDHLEEMLEGLPAEIAAHAVRRLHNYGRAEASPFLQRFGLNPATP